MGAKSPLGIVGGPILSANLPPVASVGLDTIAFTIDQGMMVAKGGGWVVEAAAASLELVQGGTDLLAVTKVTITGATLAGPSNNATLAILTGSSTFAASCGYTLPAGASHNLGPAPTSGVFTAGTTNRFIVTPNAGGSTLDSITAPSDGFPILLYNPSLTLSLALLDRNNAATTGTAGNLFDCPNPNGLAANAIQVFLPPKSGQKLTYVVNMWVFA